MPKPDRPTIDESVIIYLRALSGVNKSISTISASRPDRAQLAGFLAGTTCAVSAAADVIRSDVMGCLAEPAINHDSRRRAPTRSR